MNLFAPQNIQTKVELLMLSNLLNNVISPKDSSPVISLVQDTPIGLYYLSLEKELDALDLEIHRVKNADIFQKAATHNRKKIVVSNRKAKLLRRISRLFFYPDNKRGWIKPAISKGLSQVR